MDLSAVVLPGAQALATAMLGDAWTATRDVIAGRWGRDRREERAQAEARLDRSRAEALALAGDGAARDSVLAAYWAGYLAALLAERPDLLATVRELGSAAHPVAPGGVHNSNTGTVHGKLLQAGDIHGNVNL